MMNETNLNPLSIWRMSRYNCSDIPTTSLLFLTSSQESIAEIEALDVLLQCKQQAATFPFSK